MSENDRAELEPWQIQSSDSVLAVPPWFSVVRDTIALPDGRQIDDFYRIESKEYVEILPIDAERRMLGLWRYKHGVGKVNLGLPAGYIEPGEDPAETAKRELAEEVGLRSDHWESLGAYTVDGNRGVGRCHVFLARDCHAAESQPSSDDLEEARETWLTLDEWSTHLRKGDVTTLGAAVSVLWALVRLQENQA